MNERIIKLKFYAILFFLIISVFHPGQVISQTAGESSSPPQAAPAETEMAPDDALGRGTPRGAIVGFLRAADEFDFEKAAEYLDLRNLPADLKRTDGAELARQFNHVLSRAVWFDDYTVSDDPKGLQGDGLPAYRDELVKVPINGTRIPIWLQHIPRGDGTMIWKISNRSVAEIPQLYDYYSYNPVVERIRTWFPADASFLGLEAFKWFIVLALALLSWPLFYGLGLVLSRIFSSPERPTYPLVRKIFTRPLVAVAILLVVQQTLLTLGLSARAQQVTEAHTLRILVIVWAFWSILSLVHAHQANKLQGQGRPGAAKLLRPIMTLLKLLVVLFGILYWLSNIGVNITTLLAGLGVGGLAVALALQRPLEDMMGALSIFSQAPIRVGDFCRYGEIFGVVEDIGLRSTRIRTLENTLVHVPNARIAHVEIENYAARSKIRYGPTLRLRYDTTAEQIREIRQRITEMLHEHERVHDEPIRVRFHEFDVDAILVSVHCYMITTDLTESYEIREDLNLRVMEIVESAGGSFALPGRSLYVEERAAIPEGNSAS